MIGQFYLFIYFNIFCILTFHNLKNYLNLKIFNLKNTYLLGPWLF